MSDNCCSTTDPITDPITDPNTDPITDPITDRITDPITDPITDHDELKFITFNLLEPVARDNDEQYPMVQRINLKIDVRIRRIKKVSLLWIGTKHVICYQGLDDESNALLTDFFHDNNYCFHSEYCEEIKSGIGIAYPPISAIAESSECAIFKCKDLIRPIYKKLYDNIIDNIINGVNIINPTSNNDQCLELSVMHLN
jgi:hypothetical protein